MIKCIHCGKEYSKKGIGTHIWRNHGNGINFDPNKGYKEGRVIWNKGLTKELDDRVKKSGETLRTNYENGTNTPSFLGKHHSVEVRKQMSIRRKKACESIEERNHMKFIGRKGGFGKKGYTQNGTYYMSNFEKQCFEYLEQNNIKFEPHKNIPNSSKVSDIYLIEKDLWIELDGINREALKQWLGINYERWIEKLNIYHKNKLKYKIIYNTQEFISLFSLMIE
jgi:hypothetical protein